MEDIITIDRLLIIMLFFCMGGRYLKLAVNGRSMVFRGEKSAPEEKDD